MAMRMGFWLFFEILLSAGIALAQPNVTAWNLLMDGYHDKNIEKRRQAVTAIGSIGETPETIKLLDEAIRDPDPYMRQTGVAVAGQMKCKRCIPYLKAALDDEAPEVAFTAAKALWDMGDQEGRGILEEVLTGERKDAPGAFDSAKRDAQAKLHSPKALALMGAKEASGALLGPFGIGITAAEMAFKDGSSAGRTLAVTMLAQDCTPRILQLLQWDLDHDKNWAVKAAEARAIGQCHNPDAIPSLEKLLSDSHDAVKYMAAASIVRLSIKPTGESAASSAR